MKTYTFPQEYKANVLRRTLVGTGIVCLLAMGLGVFAGVSSANANGGIGPDRIVPGVVGLFMLVMVFGFAIRRSYRRERKRLEAPQIEFGDDMIAKPLGLLPRVEIRRDEVASIDEVGLGLRVIAENPRRGLIVSNRLDHTDYEEIKTELAEWAPIKPQSAAQKWLGWLYGVMLVMGFGILCLSWSLWVVIPVAVALVGVFGYFLWQIRHLAKTSQGRKLLLGYGFGVAFIFLIIAAKLWLVVTLMNSAP